MMRKPKQCWSKSIGERGSRVRVYEARPGGPLHRSVYINGKEDRKSLGHRDRVRATQQAYELLGQLLAHDAVIENRDLTIGVLARLYLRSPDHLAKRPRTASEDSRKLERVVAFLGRTRNVRSLSKSDLIRYATARRRGDGRLIGIKAGVGVGERTIEADLVTLKTALRWAQRERTRTGHPLLCENPLADVRLPREKNPCRPVMRHDEFIGLLRVSGDIDPRLTLALVIAEGSGRRLSAIRALRWDDIDLRSSTIRWRAENDKTGYEHVIPVSARVREALALWRREQGSIGNALVFPSPRAPAKPCSRHLFDGWLRKAYRKAKLTPNPGGLWHPLRRKWATERKDYPLKDVAAAGGWRDERTMLSSYQQADPETVRRVVLHPTRRLADG